MTACLGKTLWFPSTPAHKCDSFMAGQSKSWVTMYLCAQNARLALAIGHIFGWWPKNTHIKIAQYFLQFKNLICQIVYFSHSSLQTLLEFHMLISKGQCQSEYIKTDFTYSSKLQNIKYFKIPFHELLVSHASNKFSVLFQRIHCQRENFCACLKQKSQRQNHNLTIQKSGELELVEALKVSQT